MLYHPSKSPIPYERVQPRRKNIAGYLYRSTTSKGYVLINKHVVDEFWWPLAGKRGMIFEHRLVMAQSLGRCLQLWEVVHHKNGVKDDNRIENLQLVSDTRHNQITLLERRIKQLEARVTILEAENVLLKTSSIVNH